MCKSGKDKKGEVVKIGERCWVGIGGKLLTLGVIKSMVRNSYNRRYGKEDC